MKDIPTTIARQSYKSRSKPLSSQRLVNMYAEAKPVQGKSDLQNKHTFSLFPTPGLKFFATVGSGPIWGATVFKGLAFIVSGDNVYTLTTAGTVTNLGSIGTTSKSVIMDNNRNHVVILKDDGTAYIADSTSLTQITDVDYASSSSVTELDNYIIFTKQNSDQYFISDLNDATSYNPLDFATAEQNADLLVRAFAHRGELWLFGERTTEIHFNAGAGDFPFLPNKGATIDRGCGARRTVATDDNTIFWLGEDLVVYTAQGYNNIRISTHAIEEEFNSYATIDDAEAFIYTQAGHKFYVLTFPTQKTTWVYDITTGLWAERQSFEKERWRAAHHIFAFNKNLVGDFENGTIYELDLSLFTENGTTIQRIITLPTLAANRKRFIIDELTIDIDTGVGIQTGQGSDPQVILDWSDDGGRTFSNEQWTGLGKIGEYKKRLIWHRLGLARERIFRLTLSDPVQFNIHGGYIDARILGS